MGTAHLCRSPFDQCNARTLNPSASGRVLLFVSVDLRPAGESRSPDGSPKQHAADCGGTQGQAITAFMCDFTPGADSSERAGGANGGVFLKGREILKNI